MSFAPKEYCNSRAFLTMTMRTLTKTLRARIVWSATVRNDLDHFLGHSTRPRLKRASAANYKALNLLSRSASCINAYGSIAA